MTNKSKAQRIIEGAASIYEPESQTSVTVTQTDEPWIIVNQATGELVNGTNTFPTKEACQRWMTDQQLNTDENIQPITWTSAVDQGYVDAE